MPALPSMPFPRVTPIIQKYRRAGFYVGCISILLSLAFFWIYRFSHTQAVEFRTNGAQGEIIKVEGTSMSPAIRSGALLEHFRGYYQNHLVQRGDLVTFRVPTEQKILIKRAIAVPGDRIEMRDWSLLVNGEEAKTLRGIPYEFRSESVAAMVSMARVVPEGMFLAMGEARRGSKDSSLYGFIPTSALVGKAKLRDP